ncbi:MAG: hypothetical protein ACM3JL_01255 [Nitrososphaerota archaeon]
MKSDKLAWRGTHLPLVALCLLGCSVLFGCGSTREASSLKGKALTRAVLHLHQGASLVEAKKQLGDPISEVEDGSRAGLNYGTWQLSFVHGRLKERSRVLSPKGKRRNVHGNALHHAVLHFPTGTTIGKVRMKLGTPEAVYLIYEGSRHPRMVLRYGSWELTFTKGKLVFRTQ